MDAINLSSKLPDDELHNEDDDDDNDDTASTSSVKTKIAKASIERDIPTDIEEEVEEEEAIIPNSLDKIKALIRNDSETYPQSDYTDTTDEDATPSPLHSRNASQDSTADKLNLLNCDYSIIPEELPFDSCPDNRSPLHDSGRNSSVGSAGSESCPTVQQLQLSPSTVTVTPTGSNELACAAISHKLTAIAEVAESLDAVIRDCSGAIDVDLSKKLASNAVSNEVSSKEIRRMIIN